MRLSDADFDRLLAAGQRPAVPLINIGSGDEITIADLARMIADATGFDGTIRFDPDKPDGTPRKLLDSDSIRAMGWRPSLTLREGLRRILQGHPDGSVAGTAFGPRKSASRQ